MQLYSIVAHVPHTLGCVEIVTRHISDARERTAALALSHARLLVMLHARCAPPPPPAVSPP